MLRAIGVGLLGLAAWLGFSRRAEASTGAAATSPLPVDAGADPAPPVAPVPEGPLAYLAIARQVNDQLGNPFELALIMGIMQTESSFRPHVVSPKGAIGLMQIMPFVATDRGYTPDQMYDPATNIRCGIEHLLWSRNYLAARLGTVTEAQLLSSYNAGVGYVSKGGTVGSYVATVQRYRDNWRSSGVA